MTSRPIFVCLFQPGCTCGILPCFTLPFIPAFSLQQHCPPRACPGPVPAAHPCRTHLLGVGVIHRKGCTWHPSRQSTSWLRKFYAKLSCAAAVHGLGEPSAVFLAGLLGERGGRESLAALAERGVSRRARLDAEGSYRCSSTGLIFEVTAAAGITYSLLSWSKYAALVEKPWIVGGPLFDVRCSEPGALLSIQFPHCLCLGGHGAGVAFKVLHIKGGGAAIEPSAEFSASHVKWLVSSLSPVGPLIHSHEPLQYHGAVILYKAIDEHPSLSFCVYLATNNDSFIKDISKAVKHSKRKFVQIEKPPVCQKLLQEGKKYRLICEPEAEITPEEIEFVDGSLLKLKSYFEVYLEKPDDFTLSLVEQDSDETVWKAKLRERDWIHYDQNRNEQKRSTGSVKRRKPALNILEEEGLHSKKQKTGSTADGMGAKSLTDQQLLVIAKLLDRHWREMAIECLQMEMKDIDDIRAMEEDVTMQKLLVLRKWREREQGRGTAEALQRSLGEKATYEILQALQGFLAQS
ncbi:caspase recruitment domain-containing protein 8 isoform X1 [Onychostruthus taczanowskii]|uniref:caspase recruitment domain-containing protein 8 isoform X1 n=1 Tax=Onychostruthus taczanowskii TaxID=356909 RepID=UPI001B80C048|nr:caspase recruitment domain-containing protein 8 isoform X1 [Onychostruthus taczanowskii]